MPRLIKKQVAIVGGPAHMDFFLALAKLGHYRGAVNFQYRPTRGRRVQRAEVVLLGIEAKDGWSKNWLFHGRFEAGQAGRFEVEAGQAVHGNYNTERRDGWIAPRDDARPT